LVKKGIRGKTKGKKEEREPDEPNLRKRKHLWNEGRDHCQRANPRLSENSSKKRKEEKREKRKNTGFQVEQWFSITKGGSLGGGSGRLGVRGGEGDKTNVGSLGRGKLGRSRKKTKRATERGKELILFKS